MSFTFLHASDLHLGSPLIGLALKDGEVAKRFAAASREAFSDLVTRAVELKVAFVVIAGDVYDGEWKDTSIGLFFNREIARLDRVGHWRGDAGRITSGASVTDASRFLS
jgi:DNA repair exonuclease SbcCD nuclease subunit